MLDQRIEHCEDLSILRRCSGEERDLRILRNLHNRIKREVIKGGVKKYHSTFIPEIRLPDRNKEGVDQAACRS